MVRIMSFNIRCSDVNGVTWEERRGLVSRQILDVLPDSVGVQEAHSGWMDSLCNDLNAKYDYIGIGRDDGERGGEFTAIFYLKDKYEVKESGNFWLSKTPEKPSKGWDAACVRICTWALLRERATGKEYAHINTHFDHRGRKAQKNSVGMIHGKVGQFDGLPVVFTADLNILEGSDIYHKMVSSVLKDAKHLAEDTMSASTFHGGKPGKYKEHIIDYILVNGLVTPIRYRVLTDGIDGELVSDHYPIFADCEI